MCNTLGAIFRPIGRALAPKMPKAVKQQNQLALEAAQTKIAAQKVAALQEREDALTGGVRMLIGSGSRSGYRS